MACRLTGRAAFRKALLSRQDILIEVPDALVDQGVDELVTFLLPQVEVKAF